MRFTTTFLLLLTVCFSKAQQATELPAAVIPVFRQVSYPFLPSITSNKFYFTSDGLMWFSTANGLASFDGTSVQFHNAVPLAHAFDLNRIDAFAEDHKQNLFLGTRAGLLYYNRKTKGIAKINYRYTDTDKKLLSSVSAIHIDSAGIVYAGSMARGLFVFNPQTGRTDHVNMDISKQDSWENITHNTVKSIAPHFRDKDKLWLGTYSGIKLFDKRSGRLSGKFNLVNPSRSYDGREKAHYDVQKMEVINDSVIWFNSWAGGFCRYNANTSEVHVFAQRYLPGLGDRFSKAVIPSFCRLRDDYFFIGAHNNNSGVFDTASKKLFPVNITGLQDYYDKLDFVTRDPEDNIWVLRNGMLYVSVPQYRRLRSTDISRQLTPDNNANELRGIYFDAKTHRYFGAVRHSSGVYVFDSSFRLLEIIPAPLFTNRYTYRETCTDNITIDGSGRVWVTGHETYIKLPAMKKFDYIRNVLPSLSWVEKKGEFFDLMSTRNGDILLRGEEGHVYIINHRTLHTDTARIQPFDYNGNFQITNSPLLYDSLRSVIYYSNTYGMIQYHLERKTLRILSADEFLGPEQSGLPLLKIALDGKGRIWVMRANTGFRILDPGTLKCIDSFRIGERGLPAENYSNLIGGGGDYMFLQGQYDVVMYNYVKQHSFVFNNSNGLKYPVAHSLLSCNDHLVLGQSNTIQYYPTSDFSRNRFTLQPRLNWIRSDTVIVYERETSILYEPVRLRYFQNNLQFSFSAPEFIFPERIEYAYQLSGFEEKWQYASYFKREVSYTGLKPGQYVFRVKAQVRGGNWNTEPIEYTIIIKPAIWQTKLFKFLLWGLPALAVILFFRLRVQSIRRKERLKAQHEKELLELEARALRAQMNPHFIFNCLNSIKSLIQDDQKDKSVLYLTTFSKLIRTLFNNADKKEISLYDELETCRYYMELEALRFDAKFTWSVKVDETIDLKSIQVPAMIIQPFIENAIWHGIMPKGRGHVSLEILRRNSNIEIRIEDDGIGREASSLNKGTSQIGHQSRGVNLTQSRLELDNLLQQRKAQLTISDKTAPGGTATGTLVVIDLEGEE